MNCTFVFKKSFIPFATILSEMSVRGALLKIQSNSSELMKYLNAKYVLWGGNTRRIKNIVLEVR